MEKQLPQDIIRKSKKCKYGKKASTYREFKKKEKKKKKIKINLVQLFKIPQLKLPFNRL